MLGVEHTTNTAGFRLENIEVQDLTPDLVKQYRDMPASPVERDVDKSHVRHLREKADAGRLVSFHWVTAEVAGKPEAILRINGQHSSSMLAEMDGMMPSGLKVIREHYVCDDDSAVALLFQQWDDKRSGRDASDISGVYQGLQPDLKDVPKPYGKLAIDGYAWFMRSVEKAKVLPIGDMVYTGFEDKTLHPFIKWFATLHNSKTRELQLRPVTGAVYGTFQSNEGAARPFWEEVSRGGDPDQEDLPTTALDRWLRTLYEDEKPKKFGAGNYYQGCIYCWNAYRENKKVTTVKYEVKKNFAPIRE